MRYQTFFWQIFLALVAMSAISLLTFIYCIRHDFDVLESLLLALIPAFIFGLVFAFQLSRPLLNLRSNLKKIADGLVSDEGILVRSDVVEIRDLAETVDKVRSELKSRVEMVLVQKREQDALLASMAEGVLAIDVDFKVLHANQAALKILGLPPESIVHKSIFESIRNTEIVEFIRESLQKNEMIEKDIEMMGARTKYLQVHATPLRAEGGRLLGAVLVFSDVSRIRELEGMRKNFVANVSHELRTPLTSIQGFAETLMNPAVKDPEEIKKFIEIIQRHASRLGRIIEDILTLSRIERDSEANQIELKKENMHSLLSNAVELCLVKAQRKNIKLSLDCPPNLMAMVDPYLLEQAIVNLIDNAIRYSDSGSEIQVSGRVDAEKVYLAVKDQGVGIPEKQIPRIFERFYRIDKARSRELGGTGLGLSIVKHIALAHRGQIDVKSEVGKGSTFAIVLPHQKQT